ncbi:MAG TPA: P-loop NTPase fold protein [Thermoanaerobaculia bacterium]|nr:P-loop NTPase fold protein [Thermoanaerobaculia bacterium]
MTARYVNDSFTLEDGFGTTLAGDQVARMALEVETPFTLGVTGKWGSGKTSVLRRAFVTLGGNPVALAVPLGEEKEDRGSDDWGSWRFQSMVRKPLLHWPEDLQEQARGSLCVWFSPWQHQGADNPLVALLLEVQAQFTARVKLKKSLSENARRAAMAGLSLLGKVVDAAASLHAVHGIHVPKGTFDAVREAWKDAVPEPPTLGDGQRFHLLFDDAVATLLGALPGARNRTSPGRLIVFVDDLDRCEESVVVQLLESIKLYLGSSRCVFVLAIDESAVLAALERHWHGRPEDANREYLEKLFQAIVPVPAPRPAELRTFLTLQLAEHRFPEPPRCAQLVEELIEPNPRKIKNFVNSACAGWQMLRAAGAAPEGDAEGALDFARRYLLFQYLRAQHKAVWRLLERQRWSLRLLGKVLTRTVEQQIQLPETVVKEDQRMLEHIFIRAFEHILDHKGDQEDHHRFLPIAEAVNLAVERIDRKRSDECFAHYFIDLIGTGMDLPEILLTLPAPPEAPAEGLPQDHA